MNALAQNIPFLIITLLAIDGMHFVFARALREHMHPVASAVWVMGIGMTAVAVYAASQGKFRFETFRKNIRFFATVGILVAVSTTINYTAVTFIDPGTAALLSQTSILFGVGLGVLWLRDKLTRRQMLGTVVAVVGVVIITFQPGDFLRLGALMVIVSSLFYALHAAVVKRYGSEIEFVEFFLWRLASTTGFLLISAGVQGQLTVPPSTAAWGWVLVTGTVDVFISRTLYYLSLRRLSVSIHSIIFTLSPVVAIIWSLALFGTQPSLRDLLGGVAVLIGVGIVTFRRR